jgi:AraC-like DNA-binding protein
MLNLVEEIRTSNRYNKLAIGEILFAEYTCPLEEPSVAVWAETDYLVHVVQGKKVWHTTDGRWSAEEGQTIFFKKGAAIVDQYFDSDFCLLLFFIPDGFVKEVAREFAGEIRAVGPGGRADHCAIRVRSDVALSAFFQSMLSYFAGKEKPSEALLRLKVKELILGVMTGRANPALASYFRSLAEQTAPRVGPIMEANFRYNLSLENYAELCHRSLSSFKRDFSAHFGESPGRWLQRKRLEYAAVLLRSETMSVSQIVFESGFEDLSHFSRAFKGKFGVAPTEFRARPKRPRRALARAR